MYACIHAPAFAVQAALRLQPELQHLPVAILDGDPPLERVLAANDQALRLGVTQGMSRLQAEYFSGMRLLKRSPIQEKAAEGALLSCAAQYSPRIEKVVFKNYSAPCGTVVLDIEGTQRLFGDAYSVASNLRLLAEAYGLRTNIAVSGNFLASVCAARGIEGITILPVSQEASVLGPLPISVLDPSPLLVETFNTWGIIRCAQLAALSEPELISRLGQEGQRLRSLARGELKHLLVPAETDAESELIESTTLDYPVELLEPLLFIFAGMLERLLLRVQIRSLAIASLTLRLAYANDAMNPAHFHQRTVRPALPCRDGRRLLKLIQIDLENHPPCAAIHAIELTATSGRVQTAQHAIFIAQSPEPGKLDILMARLAKLFGGDRIGAPRLIDTHRSDRFRLTTFDPFHAEIHHKIPQLSDQSWPTIFRVCRPPRAIRVGMISDKPANITVDGEHFAVETRAGPWRKNGEWWSHAAWCREEWDVVLTREPSRHTIAMACRIAHDPGSQCWYLEGIYD